MAYVSVRPPQAWCRPASLRTAYSSRSTRGRECDVRVVPMATVNHSVDDPPISQLANAQYRQARAFQVECFHAPSMASTTSSTFRPFLRQACRNNHSRRAVSSIWVACAGVWCRGSDASAPAISLNGAPAGSDCSRPAQQVGVGLFSHRRSQSLLLEFSGCEALPSANFTSLSLWSSLSLAMSRRHSRATCCRQTVLSAAATSASVRVGRRSRWIGQAPTRLRRKQQNADADSSTNDCQYGRTKTGLVAAIAGMAGRPVAATLRRRAHNCRAVPSS